MNSRMMSSLMIVGLVVLLSGPMTLAQPGMGRRGGMGPGGFQRMYDPKTVQTLTGEVTSIDTIAGSRRMAGGVHVVVKSDTGSVSVQLGPTWYLDKQETKIAKGDKITVTGSRISLDGKPAIVASEVKKGENTLRLRDKNGVPLWSRRQK
jgi:hypothetical protein